MAKLPRKVEQTCTQNYCFAQSPTNVSSPEAKFSLYSAPFAVLVPVLAQTTWETCSPVSPVIHLCHYYRLTMLCDGSSA